MGTDFKCGCRHSCGEWLLCNKHEGLIISITEVDLGEEDG